jgi:hypothetical protein
MRCLPLSNYLGHNGFKSDAESPLAQYRNVVSRPTETKNDTIKRKS